MMLTIKLGRGNLAIILISAFASLLLTACGPPGPRALHKGDRLVKEGRFQEAIPVLTEATDLLATAPNAVQARAWNLRGLALQRAQQPSQAYQAYQQALKLDRNLAVVDYNLGCLQMSQSNYPAAIDALTTYMALRPHDPVGMMRLGQAHFHYALSRPTVERNRFLDVAMREYDTADRISPSAEACSQIGLIELKRTGGSPEGVKYAVQRFNQALQRQTNYAPALLNLAIVAQENLHDSKDAIERYRQYVALDPPPPDTNDVQRLINQLEVDERITITPHVDAKPPVVAPRPAAVTPTNIPTVVRTNPPPTPAPTVTQNPPSNVVPATPQRPVVTSPPPVSPRKIVPAPAPTVVTPPARVETPRAREETPPPAPEPTAMVSNVPPADQTITLDAGMAEPETARPRKTLIEKMNPKNWFGGRKPPEREPTVQPIPSSESPGGIDHYTYAPPVTPIPGNSREAQRWAATGTQAQREGRLDDAMTDFQKSLDADSTYFPAALSLGLTAIDAKDYATALTALDKALKLRSDSADARYAFAWVLQKKTYYQDAAAELEKLVAQHPDQIRAHLLLGNLYAQKLNQPRPARDHYLRVLMLDPKNSQAGAIKAWLDRSQ